MTSAPGNAADPSDKDLLAAHVAGDPAAFGVLFGRHRDRLWAVALRTMGNPEDAADGLQDAMVAAWRRASTYRGEAAVTTWLHRVVVNACLDRLRASSVRRTDPLPDDLDTAPARTTPAGAPEDPADLSVRAEQRQLVIDALRQLTPEQRAALVLVDMEGHSVSEAADMLGCAVGTVKSRCARGRARLAPLLGVLAPPGPPVPSGGNREPDPPVPPSEDTRAPPALA